MFTGFGLALALFGLAGAAAGGELAGPPAGWKPLAFPSVERATVYEAREPGVLRAEARCSASALLLPLAPGALVREPRLSWRWRVERVLPPGDELLKAGDDFAARVYVMFRFDPDEASLWERARHALGSRLYGEEPPGRAINYVWSRDQPRGTAWASPYTDSARLVSMGRGPLPEWRREEVDPRADYRRLFGSEPPEALGVALMTDSDDGCQEAVAEYASFALSPVTGPRPSP